MIQVKALTTGEVAKYCQVTHRAVLQWISKGKLKAYRTPGHHSRVNMEDFLSFLDRYNMPIPEVFQKMLRKKKRVLIVEDDEGTVKTIKKILESTGNYEIDVAYNGFSAGIKFSMFKPDVITLDLRMPKMDGYEVCSLIRSNNEHDDIKILALSAFEDDNAVNRILELGATDILRKPISSKELIDKVDRLIA